jgi:hypothetical protein
MAKAVKPLNPLPSFQVSCTDCCEEDNCNSNFSLDYYSAVMGRQYSSWTRPVKNEARYNERKGLKFPY